MLNDNVSIPIQISNETFNLNELSDENKLSNNFQLKNYLNWIDQKTVSCCHS